MGGQPLNSLVIPLPDSVVGAEGRCGLSR